MQGQKLCWAAEWNWGGKTYSVSFIAPFISDFFLTLRGFTEVPFLVAMAPKTLGVKISSYPEKEFTQRLILSQKSEKQRLALKSCGLESTFRMKSIQFNGKFISTLLGSIASWLLIPNCHFYSVQTLRHNIYASTRIFASFYDTC